MAVVLAACGSVFRTLSLQLFIAVSYLTETLVSPKQLIQAGIEKLMLGEVP